ncbi:uncharacterized protein LOC128238190 [Mya arenaria]|uniref:uncharacterized protein LOC128238190 n=1 Tax=Mya arenaria TaxID=6604 RepID=UPI0022E01401|nr:uncharacterized protein LOC128238190 [Mya arenaria]
MYGPIEVISVRASDPLGLYTEATISMTVRDVDDNAAVCQPEVTLYLPSSTNRKVYIVGDLNTYCVDRDSTPANRVINFTVVMENCTRYGVEASSLLFTQNNILFANSTLLTQQRPCRVNISAGNESHRTSFLVNIRFSECPADTDFANTKWPPGRLGYTEKMNCPGHYNGSILRNCSASGVYEEPKYLCTADDIGIIYQQILNGGNISTILKNLSTATSTTEKPTGLSVGDIETSGQILDGITERINASDSLWSNTTDLFVEIASNLMDNSNIRSWKTIIDKNLLGNPTCSFLDTSKNQWSTDGCRLIEHIVSEGMVHCQCDHLTNFAILMNPSIISSAPSPEMIQQEHALRVFTIVGCSFSIVGLVLTIIVYAVFWRTVKSGRSIHLIVLCCTFLFTYILFLTGVDKTGNKDVCTAIAVLLHYSILVVFFLMLAEGITIALLVLSL